MMNRHSTNGFVYVSLRCSKDLDCREWPEIRPRHLEHPWTNASTTEQIHVHHHEYIVLLGPWLNVRECRTRPKGNCLGTNDMLKIQSKWTCKWLTLISHVQQLTNSIHPNPRHMKRWMNPNRWRESHVQQSIASPCKTKAKKNLFIESDQIFFTPEARALCEALFLLWEKQQQN